MIQPGKSFLKLKLKLNVDSFLYPDKQGTPEEGVGGLDVLLYIG